MLKYGIARAAQALAPRVALSFLVNKNDRIPYFDIHHSVFDIRYSKTVDLKTQTKDLST
jgi:hypothetical protein